MPLLWDHTVRTTGLVVKRPLRCNMAKVTLLTYSAEWNLGQITPLTSRSLSFLICALEPLWGSALLTAAELRKACPGRCSQRQFFHSAVDQITSCFKIFVNLIGTACIPVFAPFTALSGNGFVCHEMVKHLCSFSSVNCLRLPFARVPAGFSGSL